MYNNMDKPSENMLLNITSIIEMTKKLNNNMIQNEKESDEVKKIKTESFINEKNEYVNNYINSRYDKINKRNKFLTECKSGFLTAALLRVLKESMTCKINAFDESVMKSIVSQFVNEQGTGDLLRRFKYQNITLAELGRVVNEAYDMVLDKLNSYNETETNPDGSVNPTQEPKDVLKLDKGTVDEFYNNLSTINTDNATSMIKDKVQDAIQEFIDDNVENNSQVQEIINSAKSTIDNTPSTDENESTDSALTNDTNNAAPDVSEGDNGENTTNEAVLQIRTEAKRRINILNNSRTKSPFQYMVESVTREVLRDDNLRLKYMNESKVNMNGITHMAEIMYTWLEMCNTLEIVDEAYIKAYIKSLADFE